MDVVIDLRDLKWDSLRGMDKSMRDDIGEINPHKWFWLKYNAFDVSNDGSYSLWKFTNKEKYVEFCLTWL